MIAESTQIPGIGAVPAVIGTTLMILAGNNTLIARILSIKPAVAVRPEHWPLLAFLKYSFIDINTAIGIGVFLGTFTLATISYFCVENL
jgi:peptidoglycan/LPS O-acetylase OafA/YrhL